VNRFTIFDTRIAGLRIVERHRIGDERGFLSRLFCAQELAGSGWSKPIAQINYTCTKKLGTVRGMHFQHPPHAEIKLVSCLGGEVWDVAVDLRSGSSTFLEWHAERLSAENGRALLIPEGFAHGFQTLSDEAELLYCHSTAYAPHADAGLNPRDQRLRISWPLPIADLSARDAAHPPLSAVFAGIRL
jgi:dTDP-4-dehydrorhamnose 3,5-epimerase